MRSAHRRITAIAVAMTVGLCVPSFTMHVGGPHGFGPAVAQAQQAEPRVVYIGDRVVLRPIDYTPTKQEWVVSGTVVKSCEFPNGFDASSCALRIDYPAGTRIDLVSYSPTHESTIPLVVKDPAAGFSFAGTQETTVSREVGETVALRVDEELPPAANTIVWRRGAQVVKKCQVASAADVAACSYTLGAEDEGKEVTVDLLYRNRAVSTLTINVGAVTPEPGEDEPEDATLADTHEPVYPPSFAHVGQGGSSHAPTFNVVHGGVTFNRQPTPEGTSFEVVSGTAVVDAEGKLTVLTPPGMQVGEKIPVTVKVTYADGSFDTVVVEFLLVGDLMAEKYSPAYEENRTAAKGKTITVHQVGEASMPEVEYFVVEPAEGFRGWLVGIDKNTGALRLTAPEEDATPLTVTVHAVYPDASVDELTATVRINPEGSDASQFLPSQPVPIIVAPGEAGSFTPQGLPSGTTFDSVSDGGLENLTVDRGTGQTDFTMPRDAVPDALYLPTMDVLYSDGSDNRIATPVHVSSLAQKARPKWGAITVRAGRSASAAQTGTVPAGTTFALPRSFTPEGWHVRIDATTGHLTVTTTRNATPENHITIPVIVTYSDGSHREVAVEAEMTGGGQGSSISDRLRLSTLDWVGLAMTLLVGILTTLAASQRALQLVEKINRQLQAR